ncbi:uncharacterized protein VDAG_07941 [Verticillium dahliae VdLs.17]|uniref:Protein bir1 n=1 Tax=Verticillium dahliae (strain VdLs.17 / ATCC MYA-4575 / FGSC 10137) TaxID=498257 RepID=G2XCQ9_VERDV|nr:uncharacterized protein VDAG_07941 [Verticillium dahliae VdLs.17]EGY16777.1 hypothetical protein VDAG_07941 [Verticillium dahliae VdLs.17]
MATALVAPEFTFEGRKASFEKKVPAPKRRGSAATKTAKTLTWPHARFLSPESLARAGFSWRPLDGSPDNVQCFLCNKSLDGWEEGDDPLDEHVKHAPQCGWAVCAAIEAGYAGFVSEDPNLPRMLEAGKATFAGLWPHDGKRGWKCKTKQLAEAGWKWTPMAEYDDMATCAYCELALDGWEQGDKPLDEHMSRSPDCPFFALLEEHADKRKASKAKSARGSKVSRASVQSVATTVEEVSSIADDMPAEYDDSIMTTASATNKKGGRAKKTTTATTAKARKTKTKKEQSVEAQDVDSGIEEDMPPPPAKPVRGRKRASDALDDSIMTNAEAPAPKKRATKIRASNATDASVVEPASVDIEVDDAPQPKTKGRKTARGSNAKSTRKVSSASVKSTGSMASAQAAPGAFPDDDEIDRQLEADLERPLTDEEDMVQDADTEQNDTGTTQPETHATEPNVKAKNESTTGESSKLWFDPYPKVDDADVEEDLRRLEEQVAAEQQAAVEEEDASLEVPKKGRKAAGTRKVSKTKAQKTKEAKEAKAAAEAAAEAELAKQQAQKPSSPEPEEDLEEHDESVGTVVTGNSQTRSSDVRPSKRSIASRLSLAADEPDELSYHEAGSAAEEAVDDVLADAEEDIIIPEFPDIPAARQSLASRHETPEPVATTAKRASSSPAPADQENEAPAPTPSSPAPPSSIPRHLQPPSTPRHQASPAQSARQPAVSPSPSPQPSDAENQPPSARPATVKRVALAPVAATPMRHGSPSKRNVVAGLRSTTPWTAVDVDNILSSPQKGGNSNGDKENGTDRFLAHGAELTSPEKRMTVEEWIYHNAEKAEAKLKHECEVMVSRFESEGTRAMGVLEGMIVD